eukprot:10678691-Lingulodinium_polyedra.AAC.1
MEVCLPDLAARPSRGRPMALQGRHGMEASSPSWAPSTPPRISSGCWLVAPPALPSLGKPRPE